MSDSYKDIDGPVTVLTTFTIKPEHIDDFAQWFTGHAQQVRAGNGTCSLSCEVVRHDNVFVSWEKFAGPEAIEQFFSEELMKANLKDDFNKWSSELPVLKFFATNSVITA